MKKTFLIIAAVIFLASFFYSNSLSNASPYKQVNTDNIIEYTEYMVNVIGDRPYATEKEIATANWIQAKLEEIGFSISDGTLIRSSFTSYLGYTSENVIAICNMNHKKEIVDILAHYDSVPDCPGARDNAAGVAALLEMARILGTKCESINNEVRLIFAGAEEVGFHGSKAYLQSLPGDEIKKHIGAFVMDISIASLDADAILCCQTIGGRTETGYARGNLLVGVIDNLVARSVKEAYQTLTGFTEEDNGTKYISPVYHVGTDVVSFDSFRIDAANICWRRYNAETGRGGIPSEYHTPRDNTDNLDYSTIEIVAKSILLAVENISR